VGDPVLLQLPGIQPTLLMHVHDSTDIHISEQLRNHGIWEPYETRLLCELLKPGQCFVDAGANIGYFTVVAAHLVGEAGQVFAFEPEPRNLSLLNKNLSANGFCSRVVAEQAGLAERDGQAVLHLHPANKGDHQLHPDDEQPREQISIPLRSGSDFLRSRGIDTIDMLKVDTQGAEFAVIRGLLAVLRRSGASVKILLELTPWSLRRAGSSGRELLETLQTLDLPFWIVDHIEHRLVASSAEDLALWCDNVDGVAGDRGFMNILLGNRPG